MKDTGIRRKRRYECNAHCGAAKYGKSLFYSAAWSDHERYTAYDAGVNYGVKPCSECFGHHPPTAFMEIPIEMNNITAQQPIRPSSIPIALPIPSASDDSLSALKTCIIAAAALYAR